MKIGDVEIDQHFFVQETSSHPVILGEPYITAARMEMKVLENGSTYTRVKSQDRHNSIQFLMVRTNHERNLVTERHSGRTMNETERPSEGKSRGILRESYQGVGPR